MPQDRSARKRRQALAAAAFSVFGLLGAAAAPADPVTLQDATTVIAGRVTTLRLPRGDVERLQVLEGPAYGSLTVNPDRTLALVLSGTARTDDIAFTLEAGYADGTSERIAARLNVAEGPQKGGWGLGDTPYMLATDATDRVVVEPGRTHRRIHVSGRPDALSLADIAAREGRPLKKINGAFLLQRPEYGASPDHPLDEAAAMLAWQALTGRKTPAGSHWLLLERGYSYDGLARAFRNTPRGESPLHPIYIGAYGTGPSPVVTSPLKWQKDPEAGTAVVQGIEFQAPVTVLAGRNILLDDLWVQGAPMVIQTPTGFTLRNSGVVDAARDAPRQGSKDWHPIRDRISGLYVNKTRGLLLENNLFDHNGWADGYDPAGSGAKGQPPSMYSHDVYVQYDNVDVTFRDNIVMRGAAHGAQIRSGGFVEDNVFIDNNIGLRLAGGVDGTEGAYSLVTDNLITSGAHKWAKHKTGGLTMGLEDDGSLGSYLGNIVTHLADPNNPAEFAARKVSHFPLKHRGGPPYVEDTIVHNWVGSKDFSESERRAKDRNTEGLDPARMDATTIQHLAGQLLGRPSATIAEFARTLRLGAAAGSHLDVIDADAILDYFRAGFGLPPVAEPAPPGRTLRFVPDDRGEGMRWDNRLNWAPETLPGDGDSVDLGGNRVVYGGTTAIDGLDLGPGGQLTVRQGRLEVAGALVAGQGAALAIGHAGQVWTDGYAGAETLRVGAEGGRFANTGALRGAVDMEVSGQAEILLAAGSGVFAPAAGSRLAIAGSAPLVGFDGAEAGPALALLREGTTLALRADESGFARIGEFFSGAYGRRDIASAVDLDGGALALDVSALAGGAPAAQTLLAADTLLGQFGALTVTGLPDRQDVTVTVDYDRDEVMFSLGQYGQGTGQKILKARGTMRNGDDTALLDALDTVRRGREEL